MYTHNEGFSAVSNGFAVGEKGHEKQVINKLGIVTADVVGNVTGQALKSVAVTATATGAAIPAGATHVEVTATNAAHIVILPPPVPGTKITLLNGATGYELRSSDPANITINGGKAANAESAVAASTVVKVECVSATAWIGSTVTAAGVVGVLEVAAA